MRLEDLPIQKGQELTLLLPSSSAGQSVYVEDIKLADRTPHEVEGSETNPNYLVTLRLYLWRKKRYTYQVYEYYTLAIFNGWDY